MFTNAPEAGRYIEHTCIAATLGRCSLTQPNRTEPNHTHTTHFLTLLIPTLPQQHVAYSMDADVLASYLSSLPDIYSY
jgi:hypothetical protein